MIEWTVGPAREQKTSDVETRLNAICESLRESNPALSFDVENGAVWLHDANGTDYGLYSATIEGKIVDCVDGSGRTPLHRKRPAAERVPEGWGTVEA